MSEDLIKRSDAIKAIDEWIQCGTDRDDDIVISEFLSFLKGDINAIPSADRPQGWIPCSERMPKKERATYLICTESGYMYSCRWTNDMYGLGSHEWSKWGWHIMDKPQYAKVVAWMEMKPWKGADDE